jgi:galactose mutarotase-like enzyme
MLLHSYSLEDGTSCQVAPEMGCNLISWVVDGRDVFYRHPDFGTDPQKFYYGGNPVLFPCVGRTWDRSGPTPRFGIYRVHGMDGEYSMPLHGLMRSAQWNRTLEDITPDKATAEYEVTFPAEARQESYPFDLTLKLAYTLEARSLSITAAVTNNTDTVAPFALGYHPWFAVADSGRRGVEVRMPSTVEITTDPDLAIPDGGQKPFAGVLRFPTEGSFGGVYSGLVGSRATLIDSIAQRTIHVDIDCNISDFIIASPNGLPAVCVEPWTSGLGGWEALEHPDWQDKTSLELIKPGQTRTIAIKYTVE